MALVYQHVLFLICIFCTGVYSQLTVPPSTTAVLGEDVLLECSTTETNPQFTWTYATSGQILFFNGNSAATAERYKNIVLQEGTGAQTSILNISAIQLEDEGGYLCSTVSQTDTPATTMVTVEVASTPKGIDLINIDNFANYQATCDAIGSKPEETITWFLNGVQQTAPPANIVESDPDISPDPLFDKRGVFTFPATLDNYNVTLVCEIGHQTASLNRQESRPVDVQNPPYPEGIVIGFNSDGTDLTVSCNTNDEVAAAIPPMDTFYIYSNGTLINKPVSDNSVTVTEPEQDTEYRCVGGNYLGNTTTTQTFEPGRTTTTSTTSESGIATTSTTSESGTTTTSTTSESGTTTISTSSESGATTKSSTSGSESPLCTCVPTGLSSGASAAIAVLSVLLMGSVIIYIILFIVCRRHRTNSDFKQTQENDLRKNELQEATDNMAYEMVSGGDRAYTALKPDLSATPRSLIIDPENVTFFTRLGSIGRGDFGAVWKGELRSNQGQAAVAIRQIPDQISKSSNVHQAMSLLLELPDQPNIVKCLGYCQQQGIILYEFISGGTLLTHLQTAGVQSQPTYSNLKPNRVRIDEGSLLNFAWQIAKGMQFLASKKIIHGTLCSHNVLLTERKKCKLSDYGLSSLLDSNKNKPTRWSSPETMVTGVQSTEGDIWSFGIVLWEIVTLGARPYPNMTFDNVQKEVANAYKMPCPPHCGQEVYAIMSRCWEREGTSRCNFDEILKNLERVLEKTHNYLSLNKLDEGLCASSIPNC